jgi:hypothetical protein
VTLIATDGRVLEDAKLVAAKLHVEIRVLLASAAAIEGTGVSPFARVWSDVEAPVGRTLERGNGRSNEILAVDAGGVVRRTSNGKTQRIDIEIFRWTIDLLLRGETVLREDINAQSIAGVSSGVMLILASLPVLRRQTLEEELQRLAPPADPDLDRAQELLGDFARFWHAEPHPAERRKLLASLFDHVWQDNGTIVAVKPRPAFAGYFKAIDQARPNPRKPTGNAG